MNGMIRMSCLDIVWHELISGIGAVHYVTGFVLLLLYCDDLCTLWVHHYYYYYYYYCYNLLGFIALSDIA